jgi:hypothetical protein
MIIQFGLFAVMKEHIAAHILCIYDDIMSVIRCTAYAIDLGVLQLQHLHYVIIHLQKYTCQ